MKRPANEQHVIKPERAEVPLFSAFESSFVWVAPSDVYPDASTPRFSSRQRQRTTNSAIYRINLPSNCTTKKKLLATPHADSDRQRRNARNSKTMGWGVYTLLSRSVIYKRWLGRRDDSPAPHQAADACACAGACCDCCCCCACCVCCCTCCSACCTC